MWCKISSRVNTDMFVLYPILFLLAFLVFSVRYFSRGKSSRCVKLTSDLSVVPRSSVRGFPYAFPSSWCCIYEGWFASCRHIFFALFLPLPCIIYLLHPLFSFYSCLFYWFSFFAFVFLFIFVLLWVLAAWTLGSWVRIPFKAWMFVLVFLCCAVF
jgi:hypothetical protein